MLGFAGTRKWVYVQSIDGKFQRIRRWTFLVLHLVLFVTPWIRIGGHPALRIDLADRRVYAFGEIFTAADTILLLMVLLFAAFSLFFFTSIWGRLWCGYGCPQTVLLDTWIRPLEKWIEGDRITRQRRDSGRLSFDKLWRKALKWTLFASAAIVVSAAFMSFFAGARELWTGQAGRVEYALTAIFAAGWFADFAWFREQFCNYLCPYARLQGALTDEATITPTYDFVRGDPRDPKTAKAQGNCVDCFKCVNVCPQGIDIRNGFQLECINCARCIDACEDVMGRLGHASLVSYTSLTAVRTRAKPKYLRPRVGAYAALLLLIAASATGLVARRIPFEAGVSRTPGSLYTLDADGYVRNTYLLRIANNSPLETPIPFSVKVEGLADAEVVVPDLTLAPGESRIVPLVIRVPTRDPIGRTVPIEVKVSTPDGEKEIDATFKTGGAAS